MLEARLVCLRQLRVEFAQLDEISKSDAFYPWAAERERERERERDLDHRMKLLVGRFEESSKAAGRTGASLLPKVLSLKCACD